SRPWPRPVWRESAKAAGTPSTVESTMVIPPTCSVSQKASIHCQLEKMARYQRRDRLGGGNDRNAAELKEMPTTTRTGNRRKASTRQTKPLTAMSPIVVRVML